MNKTWQIYGHWTKDTNELFYIGVGGSNGKRSRDRHGRNSYWYNIVNKHDYEVEIIIDGFKSRKEAVKEEIRLQQINKPRACFQYGDGLNQIVSQKTIDKIRKAKIGFRHSEESKKKMSLASKGRYWTEEMKRIASERMSNRVITQETKKKLSDAKKGKKATDSTRQKMSKAQSLAVINCRGEVFQNARIANKTYKAKGICLVCNGYRKTSGNYSDGTKIKWKYHTEEKNK